MSKLVSKGFNIGGEVSLDQRFGFLVVVITISAPIIGLPSVWQCLYRESDSLTAVIEVGLQRLIAADKIDDLVAAQIDEVVQLRRDGSIDVVLPFALWI